VQSWWRDHVGLLIVAAGVVLGPVLAFAWYAGTGHQQGFREAALDVIAGGFFFAVLIIAGLGVIAYLAGWIFTADEDRAR
jgi:hypothetical protein